MKGGFENGKESIIVIGVLATFQQELEQYEPGKAEEHVDFRSSSVRCNSSMGGLHRSSYRGCAVYAILLSTFLSHIRLLCKFHPFRLVLVLAVFGVWVP